jgi:anti-sigma B factor antagonist/stage II sporulation protein AA (anti-sigma F factor antagonist)
MNVSEEKHGDFIVLRIEGRVDATTTPQLDKKVNSLIDAAHHKIVLNFANVEYHSSAGMRLLLSATKKLKSLGGKLVLCTPSEDVMEVIKMAGFNHILHIVSSEEKALRDY